MSKNESKNKYVNEENFINLLKDIKRKREENEKNLYEPLMQIINSSAANEEDKDMLIKFINMLDNNLKDLNPIAFTTIINISFSKLIFMYKSLDKNIPSELVIPLLNFKVDEDTWLDNMKDGVIPFMLNSGLFEKIKIKGISND